MSDETTNLTTLARQEAERRRTLIALAIAGVALAFAVWWAISNPFEPGPRPDPSEAPSPISTIAPIAQGDVTAAAGLPDALPLTAEVLDQVESLWSLVTFRGNVLNDQRGVVLAGPNIVYLVSPVGEVYQVANLDSLGADALVAWDSTRGMALLGFDNGASLRSYNMSTGAVGPAIDPCDGDTMVMPPVGTAGEGNWRLYTMCSAPGRDNLFVHSASVGDRGELIWDNNLIYVGSDLSVKLSGNVHITSRVEQPQAPATNAPGTVDEPSTEPITMQWLEVDGVELAAPSPEFMPVCDVIGPGRDGTVAAHCANARGALIWELPTDGSDPLRVIREDQFPVDSHGDQLMRIASCATDETLAVQWGNGIATEGVLTLVQDGEVTTVTIDQLPATHCFGVSGTSMLIGGPEGLALLDTSTGATTRLITSPTPTQLGLDPDQWVRGAVATEMHPLAGAEHQGTILAP